MKHQRIRQLCFSAVLVAFSGAPVFGQEKPVNQAIDESLGDHTKYEAAIEALQKAVAAHDKAGVAALVSYPINVKVNGKETSIKSAKAFVEHYDGIMTAGITKAVTAQKYEDLMVNYQGVMFGSGQVWLNGICHDNACKNFDVKVITIQEGARE
ncbi:MAG: hypothetical protein QHC90_15585 [Shinella sp.]|nr:hypothetical protein [Shinella sp.]